MESVGTAEIVIAFALFVGCQMNTVSVVKNVRSSGGNVLALVHHPLGVGFVVTNVNNVLGVVTPVFYVMNVGRGFVQFARSALVLIVEIASAFALFVGI